MLMKSGFMILAALFIILVAAQEPQNTLSLDPSADACAQGALSCEQSINSAAAWESETSGLPPSSAPEPVGASLWQPETTYWSPSATELAAPPTSEQPQAASSNPESINADAAETPPTTSEGTTGSTSVSYRFTLGSNSETSTITSGASAASPKRLSYAGLLTLLYFICSGI